MTQYQPPPGQYQQPPGQYQPPGGYSPYQPQQKKKSNVWKYVGIGCLCLFLLCIGGCLVAYFAVKGLVTGVLNEYTTTEPRAMPAVQMTDEEIQFTIDQVKLFREALEAGTAVRPLILTADQINALIQKNPEFEEAGDMIYVSIEDDMLKGDVSLPLGKLFPEMPLVAGRYFNGSAVFSINMSNEYLVILVKEFEVNGKAVPDEFMDEIRSENMAKDINSDPDFKSSIEKIESIEIKDNQLIIMPKGPKQE
jgi:hypothetical protein